MNKFVFAGILALIIVVAVVMFGSIINFTEDVDLSIIGSEVEEGGSVQIKLTSLDGTPLNGELVNVTILSEKGFSLNTESVHTINIGDNGKTQFDLDGLSPGKYTVKATFGGNDKYSANETTKIIKITKKKVVQSTPNVSQESSKSDGSSDDAIYYDAELNVYYNSDRVVVDPDGQHSEVVGYSYDDLLETQKKWENGELDI